MAAVQNWQQKVIAVLQMQEPNIYNNIKVNCIVFTLQTHFILTCVHVDQKLTYVW